MTNDTGKPNESNLEASSNNLAIKETTIKQSTEIPKSYTDLNLIAVKKADIQKVKSACKKGSHSHYMLFSILENAFIGLSTTFLGCFLSGFASEFHESQWQFWFFFVISPILSMTFFCFFIILCILTTNSENNLREFVISKLLEPIGYWNEEKK